MPVLPTVDDQVRFGLLKSVDGVSHGRGSGKKGMRATFSFNISISARTCVVMPRFIVDHSPHTYLSHGYNKIHDEIKARRKEEEDQRDDNLENRDAEVDAKLRLLSADGRLRLSLDPGTKRHSRLIPIINY